ncbi:MAG: RNA-binding transcriptional accessory protein, partial [Planctomycetes bacterium]|nr:RNA-binding transcriptional accessory protein [Planctomycetota bacterium]
MGDPVTINLRHVARGLGIPVGQVQAVLELLDDGNTVPFITRYRKDQTGGLDEEQIRRIQIRLTKLRILAERKQTILRSIEAQGKLTEKLSKQIRAAGTTKRLEDLYLPYKPKKQTLATVARSRGLEPLAAEILAAAPSCADVDARAADFVSSDRKVLTPADALLGAGHILAEQLSERADLRQRLREILQRDGKLVSTRIGGEPKAAAERPEKPRTPETPQAETKTPAPETPASETPASETPASEAPASEPPASEPPAAEPPAAEP